MNKCTNCGTELPDGVTACPTCGNPVGNPVISAAGQPAVQATPNPASTNTEPPKKKKGCGFKILIALIVIVVAVFTIASCSTCSMKAANQEPWPTGSLAQMIPSMNKKCDYVSESNQSLYISVSDRLSKEDFDEYVAQCKEKGFVVDAEEDNKEYEAYNQEGFQLRLSFLDTAYDKQLSINLDAPKATGDLVWPTMGLATKIPNPNKTKGDIINDSSSVFTVYVGEMNKAEYDAYIKQCINAGFNIDYDKSEKIFDAKNKQGDSLRIEYEGFNTVYISIHPAEDEASEADEPSSSTNTESSSSTRSSSDSGVKAAMDEYEKVIDGYVAFMKKYNNSSNPASMMSDYNKWIADCAAATEKIEAIDESKLNATDLAYYNEVMLRCADKLLEASS